MTHTCFFRKFCDSERVGNCVFARVWSLFSGTEGIMSRSGGCGGPDAVLFRLAAGLLVGLVASPSQRRTEEPAAGQGAPPGAELDAGGFAPALEAAQKSPTLEEAMHASHRSRQPNLQADARGCLADSAAGAEISNDRTRSDAQSLFSRGALAGRGVRRWPINRSPTSRPDYQHRFSQPLGTVVGGPGTIKEFRTGFKSSRKDGRGR